MKRHLEICLIVWASANHGVGIASTGHPDIVVQYKGDAVKISKSHASRIAEGLNAPINCDIKKGEQKRLPISAASSPLPFLSITLVESNHRGLESYFFTPTLIWVNECAGNE